MTRDPTDSLLSGNVEYLYENDTSVMIQANVTENQNNIGKLKDDSMFLLNVMRRTLYYELIEKNSEERKYEKSVSECNKWRSLIKTIVGKNTTVLKTISIMSGTNMEKL